LKDAIDGETSIVFSDKSTSYLNIEDCVDIHMTEKSSEQTTKETLRWVHITIGNAKRDLQKFHEIKRKYLQLYLNEVIYKLNRRYFGDRIFGRLVIVGITATGR
jgi:transposase-like protein